MPLTPADVHNVAFKKPPIGKRGYDEDEVDDFLDLIETELARLIEENNDLRGQVEELRRRGPVGGGRDTSRDTTRVGPEPVVEAGSPGGPADDRRGRRAEAAPTPPPPVVQQPIAPAPAMAAAAAGQGGEPDHVAAVNVLALAQQTAEHHVTEAKAESERIRREANAEIERLVSEARTKADAMHGDARTRAESLERDARTKASALTAEAERRHNEVMGSLEMKKTDLEKAIAELRAFEREYRTRLRSYLESQLRDLDSRGSAEPSGAPASVAAGGARPVSPSGAAAPGGSRSYGGPSVSHGDNRRHNDANNNGSGHHSH